MSNSSLITGRNEVVAKVILLHLSVILFTGEVCLGACWDNTLLGPGTPRTRYPPGPGTPLDQATPQNQAPTPPPQDQAPPRSRLQHMVNEWPVRILLECILFSIFNLFQSNRHFMKNIPHNITMPE